MRLLAGCALLRVSATGSCRDTHTQHHQREGEETLVDASEALPADEQPPEGAQPGAGPLSSRALSRVVLVREHGPSALGSPACRPSLGRNTHPDPTPTQRARRNVRLSYPRSATSFSGRRLGRPRGRRTQIVSNVCSASCTSALLALASRKPSGKPCRSTTTIHLAPLPLWVSPTCSPPFFAGANEPSKKAMDQSSCPA